MGLKIFIIEDDPTYSQVLSFRLKNSGYDNITLFDSGEGSMSEMKQKPDLVLLDFSLKGLNGFDTLLQIKKASSKSEVIVLTGLDNKKVAEECKEAGALDFLNKEEESIVKIIDLAKSIQNKKKAGRNKLIFILVFVVVVVTTLLIYLNM